MRTLRATLVTLTLGATLLLPSTATADGGAYIDMGRTHFATGSPASGTAYVAIPEPHQDLLDRGPFYVYVVPDGKWVEPGKPLPSGAIRVGTARIEAEGGRTFEISVGFTVPEVAGGYYNVQVCNDPCTITGFRETLSAYISIVGTAREGELLNENDRLYRIAASARREVRHAVDENEQLARSLEQSRSDALELSAEVSRLERELAAASEAPATDRSAAEGETDRPLIEAWALFGIAIAVVLALLAFGVAMVFARRSAPRIVVPDTIAELDVETEPLAGVR